MNTAIPEVLLHFIWQFKLFYERDLVFTDGTAVQVVSPGMYHQDSGPDFRHARLRTPDALWAGNIEIHVQSSDWYKHHHDRDSVYDNIIAHVVWNNDKEIRNRAGIVLPCIELKDVVPRLLMERYDTLLSGMFEISCTGIGRTDILTMNNWLDRLVVERLEERSIQVRMVLELCRFDWQEALHVYLFKAMGMQVNQLPFELLARRVNYSLLKSYSGSTFQIESLLLGAAGFLSAEGVDEYTDNLRNEFLYLKEKHRLSAMDVSMWKFLRMRPVNFPTVRIAELAALYASREIQPSAIRNLRHVHELRNLFECRASPYWDTHYRPGELSASRPKRPGKQAIENLLINAVIPFMFEFARHRCDAELRERCLEWLYELKPENNRIVRLWSGLGIVPESSAVSQALLQLKRNYCDARRCLNCAVGHKLLKDTLRINSDGMEQSF